jgi:hypothetical protein
MKLLMSCYTRFVLFGLVFLLPSCGKMVDWVSNSFTQASSLDDHCDIVEKYSKSITTYDQFTTVAKFDALWLSNQVRQVYVDLFALKFGKTEEQKRALLRRQFEENNHFISFYVLSLYECPLGDVHSAWTLFLTIGNKNYTPIEVKVVELSPEYVYMFGKKFNRFKVAYSVKFDAKNIDDIPLIGDNTPDMKLVFRSIKKEAVLTWDFFVGNVVRMNQEGV